MIDRGRMEQSLLFLSESDEEIAQLKTNVKRAAYLLSRKEAHAYLAQTEGSVKERECKAKTADEVVQAYEEHTDAMEAYERLAAKRETAVLIIELYRTLEASRRTGGIT